ncbi:MAG TPA: TIGR04283 family arsenosugar biosynthesis glycosyltransferase [Stellaceae bacterium]|nr:TIGR04283 family arsenosugar biosynthesis glycosyltransferase [Stellaceae bacterium]
MSTSPSLSVVIPTLNAAGVLPAALASLAPARDLLREIIVADSGSTDATAAIAAAAGATVVQGPRGRGAQLAAGADATTGAWLLFLHADTRLDASWRGVAERFIADPGNLRRAGYFAYRLDDTAAEARRLERIVAWRSRALGLPYGDQGLLLSRDFYRELGGFPPLVLMEDVALARRIGRLRLVPLAAGALTSAARYRRGYAPRMLRNLLCLSLYFAGAPPRFIARLYG